LVTFSRHRRRRRRKNQFEKSIKFHFLSFILPYPSPSWTLSPRPPPRQPSTPTRDHGPNTKRSAPPEQEAARGPASCWYPPTPSLESRVEQGPTARRSSGEGARTRNREHRPTQGAPPAKGDACRRHATHHHKTSRPARGAAPYHRRRRRRRLARAGGQDSSGLLLSLVAVATATCADADRASSLSRSLLLARTEKKSPRIIRNKYDQISQAPLLLYLLIFLPFTIKPHIPRRCLWVSKKGGM
jgi:hypothetical protein